MIELIPAIDIIGGQCVRLTKGDYDQKTVYRDSPAEVAREFENIGFKRLHVVDLDGAKSKHIVNEQVLQTITAETHLTVDFGGGIKTDEDIEKAFTAGASMVTIGSIALQTQTYSWVGWKNMVRTVSFWGLTSDTERLVSTAGKKILLRICYLS